MKLAERCTGRWRGILTALGVETKVVNGKNQPCPWCGGEDRFRFIDKRGDGFWLCNACGHGDGIEFVKRMVGGNFIAAAKLIETVVEKAPPLPRPKPYDAEKRREELNTIWASSVPITLDNPAGRYLTQRGLAPPLTCAALRWSATHWAMIAKVTGADGKPVTVQRTFINEDAEKTGRKTYWGDHPIGCAVRLQPPCDDAVGIAEGVETAMSAGVLFGVPVWAALDAHHLAKWKPPADVKRVMVFGDNDASYTGQAAAYTLAASLRVDGLEVVVQIPATQGDWNDELRRKG